MAAIDMLDKYLDEQPSTLWGRAFDVNDDTSRRKAAEWFQKQIEGFYTFNSGIPIVLQGDTDEVVRLRQENERLRMELASRPVCP